jgi:hypothetical protein
MTNFHFFADFQRMMHFSDAFIKSVGNTGNPHGLKLLKEFKGFSNFLKQTGHDSHKADHRTANFSN